MSEWPDSFIYVASMTLGMATNIAPMFHAGIDRVARVVALRGRHQTASNVGNAQKPHDEFKRMIRLLAEEAGHPALQVSTHDGHAEDFGHWAAVLDRVCNQAQADNLPVIINVTGGTKPMVIGAMLGGAQRAQFLHVGSDLRPHLISLDGQMQRLSCSGEMNLAAYLLSYGYDDRAVGARSRRRLFYEQHEDAIEAFTTALIRTPHVTKHIRDAYEKAFNKHGEFNGPGLIPYNGGPDGRFAELIGKLSGITDLELMGDRLRLGGAEAARLALGGGWLEAAMYNRLRRLVADEPTVEVDTGVLLARGQEPEEGELDVALMVGSQLHVFEMKGALDVQRARWLQQVGDWKTRLVGPHGIVAVVNPLARPDDRAIRVQQPRALRAGIQFVVGPDALKRAEDIARQVLEKARAGAADAAHR